MNIVQVVQHFFEKYSSRKHRKCFCLRNECRTNCVNREAVLRRFVCSALRLIPHAMNQETHSLNLQCFLRKPFLNYPRKVINQNSRINRHLPSFHILITAHITWPNCRMFCWQWLSGFELNFFRQGSTKEIYHCKYVCVYHVYTRSTCEMCLKEIILT